MKQAMYVYSLGHFLPYSVYNLKERKASEILLGYRETYQVPLPLLPLLLQPYLQLIKCYESNRRVNFFY